MGTNRPGSAAPVCPGCGERLQGPPRVCPHCDEDLTSLLGSAIARNVVAATRADEEAGAFEPPPRASLPRWRVRTVVAASGLAAAVVMVAAGAAIGDRGSGAAFVILGILGGIVALVPVAVFAAQDLAMKDPDAVRDPVEAARLWTKCLVQGRWRRAFALTLPRGREEARLFGVLAVLGLDAEGLDFTGEDGFREAWKSALTTSGGVQRTGSFGNFERLDDEDDYAEVACSLSVTSRDAVVGLGGTTSSIPLVLRLLLVRGRWYVVDGAPGPEEPLEE